MPATRTTRTRQDRRRVTVDSIAKQCGLLGSQTRQDRRRVSRRQHCEAMRTTRGQLTLARTVDAVSRRQHCEAMRTTRTRQDRRRVAVDSIAKQCGLLGDIARTVDVGRRQHCEAMRTTAKLARTVDVAVDSIAKRCGLLGHINSPGPSTPHAVDSIAKRCGLLGLLGLPVALGRAIGPTAGDLSRRRRGADARGVDSAR